MYPKHVLNGVALCVQTLLAAMYLICCCWQGMAIQRRIAAGLWTYTALRIHWQDVQSRQSCVMHGDLETSMHHG